MRNFLTFAILAVGLPVGGWAEAIACPLGGITQDPMKRDCPKVLDGLTGVSYEFPKFTYTCTKGNYGIRYCKCEGDKKACERFYPTAKPTGRK